MSPHASEPTPLCPWCLSFIEADQPTARVNGVRWHAGCAADYHRTDTEVEETK